MTVQRLNAIVDDDTARGAGWDAIDLAQAYLDGGARFLQLRVKAAGGGRFLDMAHAIVERARDAGALVIVNDRADIAALAGADGVHVGQDDLAPAAIRRILPPGRLIGLSTHTIAQIDAAVANPIDYLAVGPVFGSRTKASGYEAVGLARVAYAAKAAGRRSLPLVAIGGITLDTAADVIRAGADSVAVIADLLAGGAPARRVEAYLQRLGASSRVEPRGPRKRGNV